MAGDEMAARGQVDAPGAENRRMAVAAVAAFKEATGLPVTAVWEIPVISAPLFVATKLEAFHNRGKGDYLASHDLEDLITVIDGREELFTEIQASEEELKRYIAAELSKLLQERDFQLALPGQLSGDAASQARLPQLLRRMRMMAELSH
jgi:predicted nucleotidyltransferase